MKQRGILHVFKKKSTRHYNKLYRRSLYPQNPLGREEIKNYYDCYFEIIFLKSLLNGNDGIVINRFSVFVCLSEWRHMICKQTVNLYCLPRGRKGKGGKSHLKVYWKKFSDWKIFIARRLLYLRIFHFFCWKLISADIVIKLLLRIGINSLFSRFRLERLKTGPGCWKKFNLIN